MADSTAPATTIRVFGGVGLEEAGRTVNIGGPRQRRLLALLAIQAGQVVSNDWLSEYLWGDGDRPTEPDSALRTYVSRLRQSLPDGTREWLVTEPSGYRLAVPPDLLEHHRFTELRAAARRAREAGDPAAAKQRLDQAIGLWRGDPFRELEDLDWARTEIERLRLDRLEVLEERWETSLALGRHTQITGELAAFTQDHPLRERAVAQYALALHRSGRTTEGLRVIAHHRQLVAESSGLDPSPALVELEGAMLAGDPALDPVVEAIPVRGYRMLEQVGAGAFSIVWRGVQPSVERPVAIKQIRSDLASQPDFIRRFEAEAHLVARIEHPHVVPLIDYWRDPEGAYLVMRWLPGGTLERRLDDGPLTIDDTLAIVRQIGAALSAAHAQDVIHRDVKSANVLFDDGGNAFLTDFGIALPVAESSGPAAALSTGSPAYASPEQLRREPLGPASDIFSLAVMAYECLAGRTPFADGAPAERLLERQLHEVPAPIDDLRPEVPGHVAAALARAMAKDPADRFASVGDFLTVLDGATTASAAESEPPAIGDNPYLGLRAFDRADAGRFFGRRRLVAEMVGRLASPDDIRSRALIVVGPSGSGKSSVVRAGLLPALQAGAVDGSDRWFTTTMTPSSYPYEALETALLRIAANPPGSLLSQLRDGPRGVLRGVRRCLAGDDDELLLVVDQFEEMFVGGPSDDAARFLDALTVAVGDPSSPLRLVCTLRADFYHRPLEHPSFAPVLKAGAVEVTPLAPDELEEAIVEPARLAGLEFEGGLVPRIAAESMGQPSPLPLLQHVLAELYERRAGLLLTSTAYEAVGGLSGAVAARAESIYDDADDAERAATRRLFGSLTDPGEDRRDLRRRVAVEDLGDTPAMEWVLDRFGAARLVTFDRDITTRRPTVEVAHEALLREWPRLVDWLEEDRDILRSIDRLTAAAAAWDESGRRPSDLIRGERLAQAVALTASEPDRLRPLDLAYVEAAQAVERAEQRAERLRLRRLRRLNVGVSIALVSALAAAWAAFSQRNAAERATEAAETAASEAQLAEADAEQARDAAELAALIGRSEALVDEDIDLAILLALEAHRRSPGPTTERAVLHALAAAPGRVTTVDLPEADAAACTAFDSPLTLSADGLTGFTTVDERLVTVDLTTGAITDRGPAPAPCVLWTGDEDAGVRWAARESPHAPAELRWTGPWDGPLAEADPLSVGAFLPGSLVGDRILASGPGLDLLVVEPQSGEVITSIAAAFGLFILGPSWSQSGQGWAVGETGRYIALSLDNASREDPRPSVAVLDGRTGEQLHRIPVDQPPTAISIHEDVAFVGGVFGAVTTVDLDTGEITSVVDTLSGAEIVAIGARGDGNAVVVSGNQVEIVDPRRGTVGRPLEIPVGEAVVRPDGKVTVVDPSRTRVSTVEMHTTALVDSSFELPAASTVGLGADRAAVVMPGGLVETIDLPTGQRRVLDGGAGDGEGAIAAFPTVDGLVVLYEGAVIERREGDEPVERTSLSTSPNRTGFTPPSFIRSDVAPGPSHASGGAVIVFVTGEFEEAHRIDWQGTGLESHLVTTNLALVSAVTGADDSTHVLNEQGLMRSYDADGRWFNETRTAIRLPLAVAGDATGLIAVGGLGGAVVVDPTTSEVVPIPGLGNVAGLAFSPGGEILVVLGRDGSVDLWDVASRERVGRIWVGTEPAQPSQPWFTANGDTVWVATGGRLLELTLDPRRWIDRACAFVQRDLTAAEWERYVPGDEPQRRICPGARSAP